MVYNIHHEAIFCQHTRLETGFGQSQNYFMKSFWFHSCPIKSAKCLFFNFFQRKKIGVEKSDFVRFGFAKSKTRVRNAPRHQWRCVQNCHELDRRMDRGARLRVNQGEAEVPVSAEAPPWQGAIIKSYNYHSQGMSKAQACGMPQSEVSGKSTATAECEARAARRLSRRRREIFWRSVKIFVWVSVKREIRSSLSLTKNRFYAILPRCFIYIVSD